MTTQSTLQTLPALGTRPASGSNPSRAETREQLSKASYDLLVIGGGILGISTAWHAAQSGLRVALVDAGDFAGATSSASSKLLHGGLRYLQTGAVKLVAENHFERRAVSRQVAPHLANPLTFYLPVYKGGPHGAAKLGAGVFAYSARRRRVTRPCPAPPCPRLRPSSAEPTAAASGASAGRSPSRSRRR